MTLLIPKGVLVKEETDPKIIKQIFKKMENSKKPLFKFLENLLMKANLSIRNISTKDINNELESLYGGVLT